MTDWIERELTEEQYRKAVEEGDARGIWTQSEVCGYGVYSEHFYERDGKYYVSFRLGSSCD